MRRLAVLVIDLVGLAVDATRTLAQGEPEPRPKGCGCDGCCRQRER